MQSESSINPGRWESDRVGGNPDAHGYGLVQWTPYTKYTNWVSGDPSTMDNNISIKEYNYEYYHYYGTEKTYVWNLVITNNSAENYLTWINKNDNVMDYAEETQIKNFFRAGRPRLFFLWSDGEYSEKILGQTFLKLLKPGESFSYNVVQKVKKEPSIKKKISIAKESVVQIYTQFKISECFDVPYLYAYNNLCLYEE